MPIFRQGTNPGAAPTPASPSISDRIFAVGKDVALSYAAPYTDIYAYARWLLGKRQAPLEFPASGDPWVGYQSPSRYGDLRVYGVRIHEGAVVTHCAVEERTEYSERPMKDFDQDSYEAQVKYISSKEGYLYAPWGTGVKKLPKQSQAASEIGREAVTKANATGTKMAKSGSTRTDVEAAVREQTAPEAKAISDANGADRANKTFQKTYISDFKPRRAELRLILQDVVFSDSSSATLVASRYEVLASLRSQMVQNPKGVQVASQGTDLKSVATYINLKNLSGRILELDMEGLRPYGVSKWVCTLFRHQEVPDADQIAVQIILVEYESLFSSTFPKVEIPSASSADGVCPDPIAPIPVQETRPPLAEFEPGDWKL